MKHDNWAEVEGEPEYCCDRCDQPTWNGAGHYLDETGSEERICGDCFAVWQALVGSRRS